MKDYEKAYLALRDDIKAAIAQIQVGRAREAEIRLQFSLLKTGEMYDICMDENDENENNE